AGVRTRPKTPLAPASRIRMMSSLESAGRLSGAAFDCKDGTARGSVTRVSVTRATARNPRSACSALQGPDPAQLRRVGHREHRPDPAVLVQVQRVDVEHLVVG